MNSMCAAIDAQVLVRFWYEGLPRTVEPYVHGISTVGTPLLRGYQTAGLSHHAGRECRLFALSKMTHVVVLDDPVRSARRLSEKRPRISCDPLPCLAG